MPCEAATSAKEMQPGGDTFNVTIHGTGSEERFLGVVLIAVGVMAAWFVSVVLFSLGWMLFGLASLRARVFPRALSVAVVIGGLIGFQAAMPPWGVALGLADEHFDTDLDRHLMTLVSRVPSSELEDRHA